MLCLYTKARYLGLCLVFLLFFDFCFFLMTIVLAYVVYLWFFSIFL